MNECVTSDNNLKFLNLVSDQTNLFTMVSIMYKQLISLMLLSSLSLVSVFKSNPVEAQTSKNVYRCITKNGQPTTVVDTKRGRIELIVWKSNFFGNSGWTPEKRCQEVTKRFQKFSDNGTLRLITHGKINNLPVICVGQQKPGQAICLKNGVLITLEKDDNAKKVMNELFDISAKVRGGIGTVRGEDDSFNLEDFLQEAPTNEITPSEKPVNPSTPQAQAQAQPQPQSQPQAQAQPQPQPQSISSSEKNPESQFKNKYSCIQHQGNPTTIVKTKRGTVQFIVWKSIYFKNSGWTPQKRCEEVTRRLQKFYEDGILNIITDGTINGQPVICVAERKPGQVATCKNNGLLITLEAKDNPEKVMKDLFDQNRLSGGNSPFVRGGSDFVININHFLQTAPLIEDTATNNSVTPKQPESSNQSQSTPPPEKTDGVECPPLLCN